MVHGNRLHENFQAGIYFHGASGKAWGNRFRDNGVNGELFNEVPHSPLAAAQRPEFAPAILDPHLDLTGLFLPQLRQALAQHLPVHARQDDMLPGLAGFLATGCSGCFRSFWDGHSHAVVAAALSPAPDARYWRLRAGFAPERLRLGRSGVVGMLLTRLAGFRNGKTDRDKHTLWLALVAPDERDLDRILASLQLPIETGTATHVKASETVVLDLSDGSTPLHRSLTAALAASRSLWTDRWRELGRIWRWPLMAALALSAAVTLAMAKWAGKGVALFKYRENWEDISQHALSRLIEGGSVAVMLYLISELWLPPHLRLFHEDDPRGKRRRQKLNDLKLAWLDPQKYLPEAVQKALSNWRELSWQQRQLFSAAGGPARSLILGNPAGWSQGNPAASDVPSTVRVENLYQTWLRRLMEAGDTGDLVWLKRLCTFRNSRQRLAVLIHLRDTYSVARLLMGPQHLPWRHGMELFVEVDNGALQLGPQTEPVVKGSSQYDLLGAYAIDTRRRLANDIRSLQWSIFDLIPSLPLGSAPSARLRIHRRDAGDLGIQLTELGPVLEVAQEFFDGRIVHHLPDRVAVDELFSLGRGAQGIDHSRPEDGQIDRENLAGRVSARRGVFDLLRTFQFEQRDWQAYIASALRFGLWMRLDDVISRQHEDSNLSDAVLCTLRDLEAICFLGKDLLAVGGAEGGYFGEIRLEGAWSQLRTKIETMPSGLDHDIVVARFLAAELACGRSSALAEHLANSIRRLWNEEEASTSHGVPITACEMFCQQSVALLSDIITGDKTMARFTLDQIRPLLWKNMPAPINDEINRIVESGCKHQRLAEKFAQVKSQDELNNLISLHKALPVRTIYALALVALNYFRNISNPESLSGAPSEDLVRVGRTLIDLRRAIINRDAAVDGRIISKDFARGAFSPNAEGKTAFEFLCTHGAAARVIELLTPSLHQSEERFRYELELESA